jgi:hypothetical protein
VKREMPFVGRPKTTSAEDGKVKSLAEERSVKTFYVG